MSKDIYIAGKINSGEASIDELATELEGRQHKVIEKWWQKGQLPKLYLDYPDTSAPASIAMINAAYNCDVFILFAEDRVLGAAVELGVAIASTKTNSNKQVIIVNPFDVRQSVFYAHPTVVAIENFQNIRSMEWY